MPDRPLTPAETAKIEAETEQIRQATEAAARQATRDEERAAAEARKFNSEALHAEVEAAAAQILLDREQEKRDRELAVFHRQHVYLFSGAVDGATVDKCIAELNYWHRTAPECAIEIVFTSPGGSVIHGMALYDYIQELRRAGHYITTATRGWAASMGGILLQAGDNRVMGAEAYILIHEVASFAAGKIGEIEDELALLKKMSDRVVQIFASRSKLTPQRIRNGWRRKDWWIDSTEAFKLGLVDEVR
jgi:ATP-dependent Clp endopeptidase proteolytic subunit ClpP